MARLDDGAIRLRSGRSVWQAGHGKDAGGEVSGNNTDEPRAPVRLTTDIVIVGAGITGAFLAERFTRAGRQVVVIDKRAPATGSTAASTAMLLWELDAPLIELEDRLGFDAASRIAQECRRAVPGIGALAAELGIDCDFRTRPSLYLAGDKLDAADLREEQRIRERAGIEGRYLDGGQLAARGFLGEAGLNYEGSAEVDPVKLARGLMRVALSRGAILVSPATASVYQEELNGVTVTTGEGDLVRAGVLILANGYELPDFVPARGHELTSTWAIATYPAQGAGWPEQALVWEAADPYLYMRPTVDGRIVAGGEDEDFTDAERREAMTGDKSRAICAGIEARCPALPALKDLDIEYAWSGVFGSTDDSLPMIGRVPGKEQSLAAFGYGGNGITFSAIAAEMLEAELGGGRGVNAEAYALDRDL